MNINCEIETSSLPNGEGDRSTVPAGTIIDRILATSSDSGVKYSCQFREGDSQGDGKAERVSFAWVPRECVDVPPIPRNLNVLDRAVLAAYESHPHAFWKGCGRETMRRWVVDNEPGKTILAIAGRYQVTAKQVRQSIEAFVKDGVFLERRAIGGYRIFEKPKDIIPF